MSLIDELRAVSENAWEQIIARMSELPRPVLAAIGAGEMAAERLAELRETVSDSISERVSANSFEPTDVRSAVSDLPGRAQKAAADLAAGFEQLATAAPGLAQELIAQLPDKLAEFQAAAQSLSPDVWRDTAQAYSNLFGLIFGNLADRGDRTWSKVRSAGSRPGSVVDAVGVSAAAPRAAQPTRPEPATDAPAPAAATADATADPTPGRPAAGPKPRKPRVPKVSPDVVVPKVAPKPVIPGTVTPVEVGAVNAGTADVGTADAGPTAKGPLTRKKAAQRVVTEPTIVTTGVDS